MQQNIFLVNRSLPGINPLLAGQEHCKTGAGWGPAIWEYYLMHYVVSGHGVFETQGKSFRLSPGDMFLIRPGQPSKYIADENQPWHYIWVGFSSDLDLDFLFDRMVISSERCENIFLSILEAESFKEAAEYFVCGKIYELISYLKIEELVQETEQTSRYVLMAKNYIETKYADDISIQMIADTLNLARSYFSTIFKKCTGKSPQAYLVDYRLEKAAHFMTNYQYTPTEAAKSCGYSDIFNFSRMFKRKYGVSPRQYQKQYAESKAFPTEHK